ncbi:MAG: hypothetical protein LBK52_02280 [Deltaproteobacteria bacterium]|jgi:hypothetical protein|nr:hypothetical protein [Deltaproteobacteria bacterium]
MASDLTAAQPAFQKGELWSETLAACRQCLEMDRCFAAELDRQIAEPEKDPLEPALWEHFIEARRNLFDYTAMNLKLLAKKPNAPEAGSSESLLRKDLLTSLTEMLALEEKLTSYLSENLDRLKETIVDLSKSQAIFSGYAGLDTKPSAIALDSLA